jgi:hypothetical protein
MEMLTVVMATLLSLGSFVNTAKISFFLFAAMSLYEAKARTATYLNILEEHFASVNGSLPNYFMIYSKKF